MCWRSQLRAQTRTSDLVCLLSSVAQETETTAVMERVIDAAYRLLSAERVTLFLVNHSRTVR